MVLVTLVRVVRVVGAPASALALEQGRLLSRAVHIVEPHRRVARVLLHAEYPFGAAEPRVPARHFGIPYVPIVVADASPLIVVKNLHQALVVAVVRVTRSQSHIAVGRESRRAGGEAEARHEQDARQHAAEPRGGRPDPEALPMKRARVFGPRRCLFLHSVSPRGLHERPCFGGECHVASCFVLGETDRQRLPRDAGLREPPLHSARKASGECASFRLQNCRARQTNGAGRAPPRSSSPPSRPPPRAAPP